MPPTTTYTLTRVFDDDDSPYGSTSFTTNEVDATNAAHMIAAGFNTMSRNFLNGAALAVVYSDGRVQFDGRAEQLAKPDPHTMSTTFNFEGSAAGETLLTFFGEDVATTYTVRGDVKFHDEPKPSDYAHVARSVLEESYADYMGIRERMYEAGVETIPASAGVDELREQINTQASTIEAQSDEIDELKRRLSYEFHARSMYEQMEGQRHESARAEMISFVKRAHAKKVRLQTAVPDGDGRSDLDYRWRGMLDVLAKFLVVTGEADKDEGHAVARRLCEIED